MALAVLGLQVPPPQRVRVARLVVGPLLLVLARSEPVAEVHPPGGAAAGTDPLLPSKRFSLLPQWVGQPLNQIRSMSGSWKLDLQPDKNGLTRDWGDGGQ